MDIKKDHINFAVGPVQISEEISRIGADPVPYFRTPDFSALMKENEALLKEFMDAPEDARAVFLTGSGTASMDAVTQNVFTKDDRLLVVAGGSFGHRFCEICEVYGIPHTAIELRQGHALTPADLAPYAGQGYTGFLVNMHETSTGVLYDMDMISAFCRENGLVLVVDAISAFLADDVSMKRWGADVVFTGSQVPIASPLSDAPLNLTCAFAMAASATPGIFVAFDRKIMLGCRSVKVRTTAFDAFESVNYPYAGVVDSSGLNLDRSVIPPQRGECVLEDTVDSDVYLLKLTPGTNPKLVDLMIEAGCHGIVIEAFGIGGLQFVRRDFVSKIEKAIDAGIPVVACSQCLYERSDFSVYQVGQKALAKGAIQGFDMTREAAVTKLMWALGHTRDLGEIRAMFHTNLAGEIAL